MRKWIFAVALSCMASAVQAASINVNSPDYPSGTRQQISMLHVFNGFGCSGQNQSPAINWSGAPRNTQSYAVTIYDPDAPTGSGWWHWIVYNIPADVTFLPRNASAEGLPEGAVQSKTDFGSQGYGGPCPPEGDRPHRYIITVHALNVEKLDVKPDASGAMVGFMINRHRIGRGMLVSRFSR